MNHDGMTMTMATGPTPTGGMGAAMTSSAAMDDHMGMGGCKISVRPPEREIGCSV